MKSAPRGKSTSKVEVVQISEHGIWLFVQDREMFMPFEQFPWFRTASIAAAMNVEMVGPEHLYWPDLDVDLALDSIEHPERFPLVSRHRADNAARPTAAGSRLKKSARKKPARRS